MTKPTHIVKSYIDIIVIAPPCDIMKRKTQMDRFGAVALTLFALNLAFNQVVIKVTAGGF